jgi:orotate phosphoribosyltransferase
VIIEDVTTAGTSINETVPILKAAGDVTIAGLCVSVDRQERGSGEKSALREKSDKYGFPTRAIVTMSEVCEYLEGAGAKSGIMTPELKASIDAYYAQYGAGD